MTEKRARIVRLVYHILFSLLSLTVAVLFIYEVCDIYFGSGGGKPFTRALVAERLGDIAVPFWLWVAMILIGIVLWEVFPPQGKKKYRQDVVYALYRLRKKLPVKADESLQKEAAQVAKYEKILKIVWCSVAVLCVIFAAAGLSYMLDFSHFSDAGNTTGDIKRAIIIICPYVICAFALCIGAAIYQWWSAKRELPYLRTLVSRGTRESVQLVGWRKTAASAVAAAESKTTLWAARGILLVVGVTFVILGSLNGGAGDVLTKAVNICTECIGLG